MMKDGHEREAKLGAANNDNPQYAQLQNAYSQNFESLKGQMKAVQEDAEFKSAVQGHATRLGVPTPTFDVASLTGELCKDWPKIKGFLNFAVSLAVFWPGVGAIATGAKAIVAMVDTQLIPSICKAE